jgi:hypothetical protein
LHVGPRPFVIGLISALQALLRLESVEAVLDVRLEFLRQHVGLELERELARPVHAHGPEGGQHLAQLGAARQVVERRREVVGRVWTAG